MKLRLSLFLAATFLSIALALAVLPACGDDSADGFDTGLDCAEVCGNECFVALPDGGCQCADGPECMLWPTDPPGVPTGRPGVTITVVP